MFTDNNNLIKENNDYVCDIFEDNKYFRKYIMHIRNDNDPEKLYKMCLGNCVDYAHAYRCKAVNFLTNLCSLRIEIDEFYKFENDVCFSFHLYKSTIHYDHLDEFLLYKKYTLEYFINDVDGIEVVSAINIKKC